MAYCATLRGETPLIGGAFAYAESSLTRIRVRGENAVEVLAPSESRERRLACLSPRRAAFFPPPEPLEPPRNRTRGFCAVFGDVSNLATKDVA